MITLDSDFVFVSQNVFEDHAFNVKGYPDIPHFLGNSYGHNKIQN